MGTSAYPWPSSVRRACRTDARGRPGHARQLEQARPDRGRPGPPRDRRSDESPPGHRLGGAPCRDRRRHSAGLCRAVDGRARPDDRSLPGPSAALVQGPGDHGRPAADRQRIRVSESGVRPNPALARPAPKPDQAVSAPDQRQGRDLNPDRALGVLLGGGLLLRRRLPPCTRSIHWLLQRSTPASRHRRADPTSATDRSAGGLTVTNLAGDYSEVPPRLPISASHGRHRGSPGERGDCPCSVHATKPIRWIPPLRVIDLHTDLVSR